jgi:hypothetical protein
MPCQLFAGLACAIPICGGGGACCCPAVAAVPCCGCAPMPICNASCCCVPLPCCAIPPLCLASWYHWKHNDDYNPGDRVDTESRRSGHYRHGAVSSVPESKYMPLDDTTTFRLDPQYYSGQRRCVTFTRPKTTVRDCSRSVPSYRLVRNIS